METVDYMEVRLSEGAEKQEGISVVVQATM